MIRATRSTVKAPDRAIALTHSIHGELTRRSGIAIPLRLWDGSELGILRQAFASFSNTPGPCACCCGLRSIWLEIRLQDYRDLDGRFDAIASVGMAEHVGPSHLGEYVGAVWRLLVDGGGFLNHCIVIGDAERVRTGRERTFANAYVFPDGGLVPVWRMVREIQQGGFEIRDVEQLRPHYALTLRRWIRNLESRHDAAVTSASEFDYRVWRIYMAGSAVGFETGSMQVVQVLGHKPGPAGTDPPLGRAWMAPAR